MKHILIFLTLLITTISSAEMTLPPKQQERQYLKKEWLKDPSFEIGNGVTPSEAGTVTYQTAWGANTLTGRSLSWNPGVAGTLTLLNYKQSNGTEFTVKANSSGSLRGSCLVNGNDSTHTYTIEIYDVTNAAVVKSEAVVIGDSASWNFQKVQSIVTPTSDTLYRLRLQATANEANIYIDDCTFGFEEGIAAVNVNQVFSALVTDGASSTTISRETDSNFITTCTNGSTGNYTCTFGTNFFTQAPNCDVQPSTASSGIIPTIVESASSVAIELDNNAGSAFDSNFILKCQRSEPNSGFEVRMDQTNYGPTSYTPTVSGFALTSSDLKHERKGAFIHIFGNIFVNTVAGTEAQLGLPGTLTVSTAYGSITRVGTTTKSTTASSTNREGAALATAGDSFLNFSRLDDSSGSINPLVEQVGSTAFTASTKFSIDVWVQIQGWTENQNAPLIIGGVTSSYSGTSKVCKARLNCDAGSAITSQDGDCIASIGNISAGACAVTFKTGFFSGTPWSANATQIGNASTSVRPLLIDSVSSTGATVDCSDSAGACTSYDFYLSVDGPR